MSTCGVDTKVFRGQHHWVKETRQAASLIPRSIHKIHGLSNDIQWGVHNSSFVNLRRGLMERVYFVERQGELTQCPSPLPGSFSRLRKKVGYHLSALCGSHSRVSREDFVGLYKGRKRTIYEKALQSLSERPVCVRDSYLKTFVKCEKLNFSKKPDPAPRVIQPRDPRYNVELGRYLKPFEHHMYRALDKMWGGPTVMKGYTTTEIGNILRDHWNKYQKPVAIGFDMSRFDQHVSVDALKFEHWLYRRAFPGDRELARLLAMQLDNRGTAYAKDGWLQYRIEGKRMSGDMNTALGNCILACCITKELMDSIGIACSLINNGDDCVLVTESRNVGVVEGILTKGWLEYGFTCVAEMPVYELEKVVFCQMQPIRVDNDNYVMVRDPRISLSKDSHSTTPFDSTTLAREWAHSIGVGGLSLTAGIPVVQEFYQCLKRNGKETHRARKKQLFYGEYYWNWIKIHNGTYTPVREEARHSFHLAFGISPDQQIAMEEYYSRVTLDWKAAPFNKEINDIEWTLQHPVPI